VSAAGRRATLVATAALALLCLLPALARADFGLLPGDEGFQVLATGEGGVVPESRAGSHPYSVTTELNFKLAGESPGQPGVPFTDGDLKDLHIDLPPGYVENPSAVPQCTQVEFSTPRVSPFEASHSGESCPLATQIGVVTIDSSVNGGSTRSFGIFNLAPPPGYPSQLGFSPYGIPVTLTPHVREGDGEYGLTLDLLNFPQQLSAHGLKLTIWGDPWNGVHDSRRGNCLNEVDPAFGHAKCRVPFPAREHPPWAYLTLPTSCDGPMVTVVRANSWQRRQFVRAVSAGEDSLEGCGQVPFEPSPVVRLSTARTTSASGFDFTLDGNSAGLLDPNRRASSQVKQAVLVLPEGMTVNPSVGAGLGVCTPAGYAAETVSSAPGAGCPNAAKIGELSIESPLFEGTLQGALFLAEPDDAATGTPGVENPFDSLLALYLVAKDPDRGILVRVAGKVIANPGSGRLTAVFDDLPQLPYSHLNVHFRDGQRSPLATPSACGAYTTAIDLAPWNDPGAFLQGSSRFDLTSGIGGGPCPNGSVAPFTPRSAAGTLNRNAGSYTPFNLQLTRTDAEQEITSYSSQLPPGLLGRLKGVPYCPEAAIAAAKGNSGFAEYADPSCPAASEVGRTNTGYGLGSVLAYGPGRLYLAGPYHGAPLSIAAVNSATVGPFDLGVIVVRSAIRIDPHTAQVSIDAAGSDPIPHIVKGIPLHLRDIRVYVDRPGFTLNPTSCDPFAVTSSLTGSGARFSYSGDDSRAATPSYFQVSNCSALGFKPTMKLELRGGTKRGDFPALKATVRPRPGDANIGPVTVTLPPTQFLAQEHIETICTRRQFEAKACPAASVYGRARAFTPLLGQPLEGPVILRASDNALPDMVAALAGNGIRIDIVGRIDSKNGGMRASFDVLPDAPVSKFVMNLEGGRQSLLVNADDVCQTRLPAVVRMLGQNNTGQVLRPRLINKRCAKAAKRSKSQSKGASR